MELGKVGLFICSQKPIGISSDHCVSPPPPAKTFLLLLADLKAGGGNQPQRGGTVERHDLIALITNNMFPDTLTGGPVPELTLPTRHTPPPPTPRTRNKNKGGALNGDTNRPLSGGGGSFRPFHPKLFQTRLPAMVHSLGDPAAPRAAPRAVYQHHTWAVGITGQDNKDNSITHGRNEAGT